MKIALYDLSVMPTTYDFAVFACSAKTLGYEEIRFVVGKPLASWKYPQELGWRRWANILVPMCRLADLPFSVGGELPGDKLYYHTGYIQEIYKRTGKITKLRSILPFGKKDYVTVTLRESFRNTWRNSSKDWEKIIQWLEKKGKTVAVLEECEDRPIPLEQRMALYCNAQMNLSVGNGPMVLCWLSEAPYLSFQLPKPQGFEKEYEQLVKQWENMKFPIGSQLEFRNKNQEIIWGPDDFSTVTKAYGRMMD